MSTKTSSSTTTITNDGVTTDKKKLTMSKLNRNVLNAFDEYFNDIFLNHPVFEGQTNIDLNTFNKTWNSKDNQHKLKLFISERDIKAKGLVSTEVTIKRPTSAYILFSTQFRHNLSEDNKEKWKADPKSKPLFQEITNMGAEAWHLASKEQTEEYLQCKAIHEKALKDYEQEKIRLQPEIDASKLKVKKTRNPKGIEKPRTVEFYYNQDERPKVIEQIGDGDKKEIVAELKRRWKTVQRDNTDIVKMYCDIRAQKMKTYDNYLESINKSTEEEKEESETEEKEDIEEADNISLSSDDEEKLIEDSESEDEKPSVVNKQVVTSNYTLPKKPSTVEVTSKVTAKRGRIEEEGGKSISKKPKRTKRVVGGV